MPNPRSQGGRVLDGVLLTSGPYQQITSLVAATGLTIPDGSETAIIQAEGQAIRWTDDGVTIPTSSVGMILQAGASIVYNGQLSKFRAIQVAGGAILNVSYYT